MSFKMYFNDKEERFDSKDGHWIVEFKGTAFDDEVAEECTVAVGFNNDKTVDILYNGEEARKGVRELLLDSVYQSLTELETDGDTHLFWLDFIGGMRESAPDLYKNFWKMFELVYREDI